MHSIKTGKSCATNSPEGFNSALKLKIKAHQGINSDRRKKISNYLPAK